jgi:hypothetical protein
VVACRSLQFYDYFSRQQRQLTHGDTLEEGSEPLDLETLIIQLKEEKIQKDLEKEEARKQLFDEARSILLRKDLVPSEISKQKETNKKKFKSIYSDEEESRIGSGIKPSFDFTLEDHLYVAGKGQPHKLSTKQRQEELMVKSQAKENEFELIGGDLSSQKNIHKEKERQELKEKTSEKFVQKHLVRDVGMIQKGLLRISLASFTTSAKDMIRQNFRLKPIRGAVYNPQYGSIIISVEKFLRVYDANTGILIGERSFLTQVTALGIDARLRKLYVGFENGDVNVYKYNNLSLLKELEPHSKIGKKNTSDSKKSTLTPSYNFPQSIIATEAMDVSFSKPVVVPIVHVSYVDHLGVVFSVSVDRTATLAGDSTPVVRHLQPLSGFKKKKKKNY